MLARPLALVAVASLLLGVGIVAFAHPEEVGAYEPPALVHEQVVDVSALPLPNGWLLVPFEARAPTAYELELRVGNVNATGSSFASGFLFGNASNGYSFGGGSGTGTPLARASHGGVVADCCSAPVPLPTASWSGGGGGIGSGFEPGTQWLAILVANARTYELEVVLRTAEDVVTVGEPIVGTSVETVDLVAAARDSTTHASLLGLSVSTSGGRMERAWSSAGAGLLAVTAHASGEAAADLLVDAPGIGARQVRLRDSYADAFVLAPGDFRVMLQDLREPGLTGILQPGSSISATALYADLPLEAHEHWFHAQAMD